MTGSKEYFVEKYCDEKWNQEKRKQIFQLLLFLTLGQNMLDRNKKLKANVDSTETHTEWCSLKMAVPKSENFKE